MGDVVQTLPAIADAQKANPDLELDWVVDRSFCEIPAWHPAVHEVLSSPPRRLSNLRSPEFQEFLRKLRAKDYDFIIDLQGHWKSATAARFAKGIHCGYTGDSVNEWGAHFLYGKRFSVPRNLHSIVRMRQLMATALRHSFDSESPDYGINRKRLPPNVVDAGEPYVVFIHSTSWESKNWAEKNWQMLRDYALKSGFRVVLPWGNQKERQQAERIAGEESKATVLPDLSISQKAAVIAEAAGTVGLDTGLSHIAAALAVPSVTLYGATDPQLTGAVGQNQVHIASVFECVKCHQSVCKHRNPAKPACLNEIPASHVWSALTKLLEVRGY
jgi:heptosyltransferase I